MNSLLIEINKEKWGLNSSNNILYITGITGSGKSTIAEEFKKQGGIEVIHLDIYFETYNKKDVSIYESKEFNKKLDKDFKNYKDMVNKEIPISIRARYWDKFARIINDFGKENFGKFKVVVEGVQIYNTTLFENPYKSLKNKPLIIITETRKDVIAERLKNRDGVKNKKDILQKLEYQETIFKSFLSRFIKNN